MGQSNPYIVPRVEMQAGVEAGHQPRLADNQIESSVSGHLNSFSKCSEVLIMVSRDNVGLNQKFWFCP